MSFKKDDEGKPKFHLIPTVAIQEEMKAMLSGLENYGKDNWKKGADYSRYFDATMRHLLAFWGGEDIDPKSKVPHLAHARASLGIIMGMMDKEIGKDDRDG